MNKRVTSVEKVKIISIGSSSIVEIGDSKQVRPTTKVIALQREQATFWGNELDMDLFSIFHAPIPQPERPEKMEIAMHHETPLIRVGELRLISMTASSVLHIGSSVVLGAEARVKHIRHLLREGVNDTLNQHAAE